VQIGDARDGQSYTSIPIARISSVKVKSQSRYRWVFMTIAAAIVAVLAIRITLYLQELWYGVSAALAGGFAWYAFRKWEQTRDERLVIASSSGETEIKRISEGNTTLLDLVDVLEERQALLTP
jgi:hypothetical protein